MGVARAGAELVEREQELDTLRLALEAACSGLPQLVLVEGPAGIGKSRLISECAEMAQQQGMKVAHARGNPFEKAYPFGVARQLGESVEFDAKTRARLTRRAPRAARPIFDGARDLSTTSAHSSYPVLVALRQILIDAAEVAPVLLVIDDAHWCDKYSLESIAYICRRLHNERVAIAMSIRPAEANGANTMMRELRNSQTRVSIAPRPLSRDGVSTIISKRLASDSSEAFASICHEISAGNPLMLEEMMKECELAKLRPSDSNVSEIVEIAPRAASRSVLLRISRLDKSCEHLARAIAVLGANSLYADAVALAELPAAEAQKSFDDLVHAEILKPSEPIDFMHPVVQEAMYQNIPPIVANDFHRNAARILSARGATSEMVAAHYLELPPEGSVVAVESLRSAASDALNVGAIEGSVLYLRRALAEPPPEDQFQPVLRDLGALEVLSNQEDGISHLLHSHKLLVDPVERGWLVAIIGRALKSLDRASEATTLIDQALGEIGNRDTSLERHLKLLRVTLAAIDRAAVPWSEVSTLLESAHEPKGNPLDDRVEDSVRCVAKALRNDSREECEDLARRSLADGILAGPYGDEASVVSSLIVLSAADSEYWNEECERSLRAARNNGSIFACITVMANKGYMMTMRGQLDDAIDVLRSSFDDVEQFGVEVARCGVAACLALALIEKGQLTEARAALAHIERFDVQPASLMSAMWQSVRLRLLVENGRNVDAVRAADQLLQRDQKIVRNVAWPEMRQPKIVALGRLGRLEAADKLADETLQLAREWGAPRAIGKALRLRGELDLKHNVEYLEESVDVLRDSMAQLEHARALAALGTSLRLRRRSHEARVPLKQALSIGDASGATAFCATVREELAITGITRNRTGDGIESLTPSEFRVARLAAQAHTNKEIAESLFVTVKTVEAHLSRAYRKLDIASRRELANTLAADPSDPLSV